MKALAEKAIELERQNDDVMPGHAQLVVSFLKEFCGHKLKFRITKLLDRDLLEILVASIKHTERLRSDMNAHNAQTDERLDKLEANANAQHLPDGMHLEVGLRP
ncbi:MAG: hypothetical protein SGARI_006523 [Bacillariaceae sp.]